MLTTGYFPPNLTHSIISVSVFMDQDLTLLKVDEILGSNQMTNNVLGSHLDQYIENQTGSEIDQELTCVRGLPPHSHVDTVARSNLFMQSDNLSSDITFASLSMMGSDMASYPIQTGNASSLSLSDDTMSSHDLDKESSREQESTPPSNQAIPMNFPITPLYSTQSLSPLSTSFMTNEYCPQPFALPACFDDVSQKSGPIRDPCACACQGESCIDPKASYHFSPGMHGCPNVISAIELPPDKRHMQVRSTRGHKPRRLGAEDQSATPITKVYIEGQIVLEMDSEHGNNPMAIKYPRNDEYVQRINECTGPVISEDIVYRKIPLQNGEIDLYTARWHMGRHLERLGWCHLCEVGDWYSMKRSQYLYHMQYEHGVNNTTKRVFDSPIAVKYLGDISHSVEVLCPQCKQWVALSHGPIRSLSFKCYFRHASYCHNRTCDNKARKKRSNIPY